MLTAGRDLNFRVMIKTIPTPDPSTVPSKGSPSRGGEIVTLRPTSVAPTTTNYRKKGSPFL
jgi:hypothetical protein